MIIPWQELEPATLNNVLDSFIYEKAPITAKENFL
ncbi:Uncharacterised protein family (UPF0270) [Actinobacillus equuli]|nr:Uncharacterised protein family (UPF0270) [Actinobacillus equuli]